MGSNKSQASQNANGFRKTVFILGAGFTEPARGPTQSELLPLLARRKALSRSLRSFFKKVFRAESPRTIAKLNLEDVFTVLDRAILFQESVRGISHQDADALRKDLLAELVKILNDRLNRPSQSHRRFAEELLNRRWAAGLEGDPFSVISLNWDVLFDRTLHEACALGGSRGGPKAMIDYCCFTYALDPEEESRGQHVSSTLVKFYGIHNLKVLKLHGSVHWLLCPQCAKLFVNFEHVNDSQRAVFCPACDERPRLAPLIITPTLLKDLQTTQLKTVWHNALTELQEAERLVFIGYSFPTADFEFRYLLAKGVRVDASICVVGRPPSSRRRSEKRANFVLEQKRLEQRYRSFFGERKIRFLQDGADDFIQGDIWRS